MLEITYEHLRNYRRQKRFHETLLKQRDELYNTYHSPSFNYSGGTFGSDPKSPVEIAMKRIEKVEQKIEQCEREMLEVENWVYSIEDAVVLPIVVDYVIAGKTFAKIARERNQYEQTVRNTYYHYMRVHLTNKQNSTKSSDTM